MKNTTKIKKPKVSETPNVSLFKLEFNNFPESSVLIDNVEMTIETGYMDGQKHLNINFSCLENENYSSWNYFAAMALKTDAWEIAKLVIYNSKGDELKTINMSVRVKRFVKKLSWNNNDLMKYDIDAEFKLGYLIE